ncbi:MAG TPA: hypothetical protein VFH66_06645 [Mycobacteriales bacterium]|nr:hypothetical protein [Mycobacteriales bacterium]
MDSDVRKGLSGLCWAAVLGIIGAWLTAWDVAFVHDFGGMVLLVAAICLVGNLIVLARALG